MHDGLRSLRHIEGQGMFIRPGNFQYFQLAGKQRCGHVVARAPRRTLGQQSRVAGQMNKHQTGRATSQDVAIGAFERGTRHHQAELFRLRPRKALGQQLQPLPPVRVGERHAGSHARDVALRPSPHLTKHKAWYLAHSQGWQYHSHWDHQSPKSHPNGMSQ